MKKIMMMLVAVLIAPMGYAGDAKSDFQKKFRAIRTMQATFTQTIYTKTKALSTSSGKMDLLRPGRFRWETVLPMAQLVIADGRRLWIYDEALEQVTVRKQSHALQSTAALFLSDDDDHILSSFNVIAQTKGSVIEYDLHSTASKVDFKHVVFQFKGEALSGMELFDALGQRTVVQFQQIKLNKSIPQNRFIFVPPKGVDVIDEGEMSD